jgi:hypothetical protein
VSQPDWKKALPKPPDGGQLLEAWFTTYDQPDAGLLVEHLLPGLLRLDNSLTLDVQERNLYFGELGTALERLRGRLTIISSPPRNRKFKNDGEEHKQDDNAGRQSAPYPWLWRYVSHFTVGAERPAVQHAKLWAFHWQTQEGELLELHVSSTNLTMSAFKGQIQAGWRTCIELEKQKPTKIRQQGWGDLIPFLDALGDSAGQNAEARTNRLVQLIARADCPSGITFVTSAPGSKERGAHALRKLQPSAIHILTPTIGDWEKDSIAAWGEDAGAAPAKLHLKWIDENHPWARGWALTEQTEKVLCGSIQLNHLKVEERFHGEHADGDARWSHAKLYLLRLPNKRKRHLLLTSANWSVSAWGAGKVNPRNFELGVLFETDWKWPEEAIKGKLTAPFTTARERAGESRLQWAEASWDGKHIALRVRSTDSKAPISAVVTFSGSTEESILLIKGEASIRWNDAERAPLAVRITQEDDSLEVDVLDLRPPSEFAKTPLPEVDPVVEKALREAFLLQRYGGPAVVEPTNTKSKKSRPDGASPTTDYSVQAWLDARSALGVVDAWRAALDKVKANPMVLEQVWLDGKHLHEIYVGRRDAASRLAAEELEWRLQEKTE